MNRPQEISLELTSDAPLAWGRLTDWTHKFAAFSPARTLRLPTKGVVLLTSRPVAEATPDIRAGRPTHAGLDG